MLYEVITTPRPDLSREPALAAASEADATIMFMGLSPRLEGEEMPVHVPGFAGGDRVEIDAAQLALMLEGIDLAGAVRRKRYRHAA